MTRFALLPVVLALLLAASGLAFLPSSSPTATVAAAEAGDGGPDPDGPVCTDCGQAGGYIDPNG